MSHLSSRSNSYEAVGGTSTRIDPLELQTEISELKYRLHKANEACSDLKQQIFTFQDENMQLLSQKEELEKRLALRDVAQDRIKQLLKELDETRRSIVRGEDVISVQNTRIQRLERDYAEMEIINAEIKKDFDLQTSELERCYKKVAAADKEIERLNTISEEEVNVWKAKEKLMEESLNNLNSTAEELHNMNNQLRKDKFELENNLIDMTGNQLAQLNNTQDENSSCCSSPGSPQFNRPYLQCSLQTEIAATIERKRTGQPHKISDSSSSKLTSGELVDVGTQSEESDEGFISGEKNERKDEKEMVDVSQLLMEIRKLISKCESDSLPMEVLKCGSMLSWDGDKTPVNEENGHEANAPACQRPYSTNGSNLRKRGVGVEPYLPIYNRKNETCSFGVIPESEREHMIRYASDPVRRSSENEARILPGEDWRILYLDLDRVDQEKYRKIFPHEEGNELEMNLGVEAGRGYGNRQDFDTEAEITMEKFPGLVEDLFDNLDVLKRTNQSDFDLEEISTRFNQLSHAYKVEHSNLIQRKNINLSKHGNATKKMVSLISSFDDAVLKFREISQNSKIPEEILEVTNTLKHLPIDLIHYTTVLTETSRGVGIMDVQVRLHKMIELMVFYVHVLKNLCAEKDKDFEYTRTLLEAHNISYTRQKTVNSVNNNNEEKVSWNGSENQEDSKRPKQLLQQLLGPKKSNANLDYKLKEKLVLRENKSSSSPMIKLFSNIYETVRCELSWPWTWEETWKGMKQGFSIILMIIGLFIIIRTFLPVANADPSFS